MNKVYLVRHGENLANITKEFSYKLVDYALTEKGRVQAQQTADYLASQNIDEIFSSPLKRATQTAEYIAKKLNKQYEIIEQFREVNVGKLEKKAPDKNSWDIYLKDAQAEYWSTGLSMHSKAAFTRDRFRSYKSSKRGSILVLSK